MGREGECERGECGWEGGGEEVVYPQMIKQHSSTPLTGLTSKMIVDLAVTLGSEGKQEEEKEEE